MVRHYHHSLLWLEMTNSIQLSLVCRYHSSECNKHFVSCHEFGHHVCGYSHCRLSAATVPCHSTYCLWSFVWNIFVHLLRVWRSKHVSDIKWNIYNDCRLIQLVNLFIFVYFCYRLGNPYIYNVLNWAKPDKAMVTVFGTLILAIIVHMFLFWVYKLRVFVQRRCFTTKLILPCNDKKQRLNGSTGSQVSMVFSTNDGHTNEAFKKNPDKVFA